MDYKYSQYKHKYKHSKNILQGDSNNIHMIKPSILLHKNGI
jgi:hypothetical protein